MSFCNRGNGEMKIQSSGRICQGSPASEGENWILSLETSDPSALGTFLGSMCRGKGHRVWNQTARVWTPALFSLSDIGHLTCVGASVLSSAKWG